ncbi:hypothetical protein [Psychroserpens sp.]|uniref:hypothetical protein n=1 Tax=Psychroserpens sp. TaxID=2020870 RepID=UPI001B268214|nr:hypothetical protein [Psychroserpens sp.]MBO6605457.1 hypothetical protein [Psychroserpens sp.]MBO6631695.1 hypothetical protein [Psychroserpens sp.]MBO6653734.1 hypothetical protein [Psychroserpens sp.]MBO6682055.1 hypothetical protein [Psychroserpens sp.]MBO6748831.1 hypothetical protein [Psychroserpens sp.]
MKTFKLNNSQMSMRSIFITVLVITFGLLNLNAQGTPEPPATPEPPKTTSGTSYSISVDNDNDYKSNSSVSIKNTNDYYKFRASFDASKNGKLEEFLRNNLGEDNLKISGSSYVWTTSANGDEIFECKLTMGHLRIYLDRNASNSKLYNKIKDLGETLKAEISGKSSRYGQTNVTRELEKAERELARAKRELKRVEREAKRAMRN